MGALYMYFDQISRWLQGLVGPTVRLPREKLPPRVLPPRDDEEDEDVVQHADPLTAEEEEDPYFTPLH